MLEQRRVRVLCAILSKTIHSGMPLHGLSILFLFLFLVYICLTSDFYSVVRHLRPLGIAANVIQAAFCRLDTVAVTFGYLIATYQQMTDEEDIPGRDAIIRSVEQRWAKTDQEVFIAAIFLNPFYRFEPFGTRFNNAEVIDMNIRLWQRFNRTRDMPPSPFMLQLSDYLKMEGKFASLPSMMQLEKDLAKELVSVLSDTFFSFS